jgi:hypothetical protein
VQASWRPRPALAGLEDGGWLQRQTTAVLRPLQNYETPTRSNDMTEFVGNHPYSYAAFSVERYEDERVAA